MSYDKPADLLHFSRGDIFAATFNF